MQNDHIQVLAELGTAALAMCGFTACLGEVERSAAAARAASGGDQRAGEGARAG